MAQKLGRPGAPRAGRGAGQNLGDLPLDVQDRVERGHGVLEDHDHAVAPDVLQLPRRQPREVAALEQDAPGRDASRRVDELDDGAARHRLPRAGFPDQRERFARPHVEADAADGMHGPAPRGNLDAEVLDGQQRLARGGRFTRPGRAGPTILRAGGTIHGSRSASSRLRSPAFTTSLALDAKQVGDAVPEQDEREPRVHTGETGHRRHPPSVREELPALRDHHPPLGSGRAHA